MCKCKFSYKTSTSNLKKHINKRHPTITLKSTITASESDTHIYRSKTDNGESMESAVDNHPSTSKQTQIACQANAPIRITQTKVDSFSNILQTKISARQKNKIDRKLLYLCVKDLQPFSIVADTGFREFVAALNPSYQLPERRIISKTLIPALYEECLTNTKNLISTGKTFCVTTDGWTSTNNTNTSYVAVTAHFLNKEFNLISVLLECSAFEKGHTAENLAAFLLKAATKWDIQDKIVFAVSDNAANIQKALQLVRWKNMGCVAHTLNLIVKDGLKNERITLILEKVREIVRYFKKSTISNNKLLRYQENTGIETPLKVILDVATRWNSTYYMLERFIRLEEAIKSTVAIIDKELPVINVEEWNIIKELCLVLKPFEDASRALSGDTY
ncbi:unnamed protein product [Acanthoscelides obtectus]|uniref:BED-type domain-containing protein n=1 Tax=Acanthoscelides obtectus TaxID=200917 RepID=A0A9P0LRD4_ACAOB|nr:unnamed protein product [Acanthoscelides obtectus]CAK1678418.1 Zinc finger BED domain-containing protein 1 [Acanthoscelides obtectus]